jgi:rhodanese-related sulfurtransferase
MHLATFLRFALRGVDRLRAGLAVALCLSIAPAACTQDMRWSAVERMIESDYPGVPRITTDSLAERLADSTAPRPVLLDARSAEEYAVSHLPGARRVDPDASSYPELDSLSTDRPVVVYCSVGYRSAKVTKQLREEGFTDVRNLKGSIFRWANEGRPVVRDSVEVEAVHPYDATWGTLLEEKYHAYE